MLNPDQLKFAFDIPGTMANRLVKNIFPCNGRIFRARTNIFINKRGEIVSQVRLIPQKRLSCPGCRFCGNDDEVIREEVDEQITLDASDFQNGELYQLRFREWANGTYECPETEYECDFVKVDRKDLKFTT